MNTTNDILIIGGGIIGLAIAVELKLRGATVTVLSRDFNQAAAHAAAGMLAPQAEGISPGPMLDLSQRSRLLYPDWVDKLVGLTGRSCGYWPCGILAPIYESQKEIEVIQHLFASGQKQINTGATWLNREAIHQYQLGLGSEVVGGWWYPEEAQVDNRALAQVLRMAAQELGVNLLEGISAESIQKQNQRVSGIKTTTDVLQAGHYILTTGAWAKDLLSVPVYPKKGQMLSVHAFPRDKHEELPLQRVLFGSEIYIVPRQDGRIVVGATSENVGFAPHNTPAGIQALLTRAIRLYPQIQDFPIQEFWWGFRPATPDELPILGESAYENLTFATGHYRNGILLTPITALLIADLVWQQKSDPLLAHFRYDRFVK